MSSIINTDDKIWKLFMAYENLIGAVGKDVGLDFYGSDQKTALAKDLVVAHMIDNVACTLKDIKEQQATFERTKYHIKPDVTTHIYERSTEEKPKNA